MQDEKQDQATADQERVEQRPVEQARHHRHGPHHRADSATSQFFINVKDNDFLDKAKAQDGVGYCVFGKVIEGMDVVDKIRKVQTGEKGMFEQDCPPKEDVTIKSIRRADQSSNGLAGRGVFGAERSNAQLRPEDSASRLTILSTAILQLPTPRDIEPLHRAMQRVRPVGVDLVTLQFRALQVVVQTITRPALSTSLAIR